MSITIEKLEETQHTDFQAHLIAKAWKDEAFRQELLSNPKAVIEKEFGKVIPDSMEIRVLEETPNIMYLALPLRPNTTGYEENLSDSDVDGVGGRLYLGQANTKTCSKNTNHCN